MNDQMTDIEQFILWFAELKAVPAETRQAFLKQVEQAGGIDQKARTMVEEEFKKLDHLSTKRLKAWESLNLAFANAETLQKKPEYSLAKSLSNRVCFWMTERTTSFKNYLKQTDAQKAHAEESQEQVAEADQIAALKAIL